MHKMIVHIITTLTNYIQTPVVIHNQGKCQSLHAAGANPVVFLLHVRIQEDVHSAIILDHANVSA